MSARDRDTLRRWRRAGSIGRWLRTPLEGMGRFDRLLTRLALMLLSRLARVEEPEGVDWRGDPLVFVMNHGNYSETVLMAAFLLMRRRGRNVSFLVDWMFGELPLARGVLRRIESIFVYNKRARLRIIERRRPRPAPYRADARCVEILEDGGAVALFPEGKANPDPERLQRARKGLGRIILGSGAPVLPVGIEYVRVTGDGRIPRLGRMLIRVGRPFLPATLETFSGGSGVDLTTEQTGCLADRIGDECMEVLSELCGKSYPYMDGTGSRCAPENPWGGLG